jgi:hypothetical protein
MIIGLRIIQTVASLSLSLSLCPFNVLVAGSAVFSSETPGAVIRLLRDTMAVEIAKMLE